MKGGGVVGGRRFGGALKLEGRGWVWGGRGVLRPINR